jgi:hypothetical protein
MPSVQRIYAIHHASVHRVHSIIHHTYTMVYVLYTRYTSYIHAVYIIPPSQCHIVYNITPSYHHPHLSIAHHVSQLHIIAIQPGLNRPPPGVWSMSRSPCRIVINISIFACKQTRPSRTFDAWSRDRAGALKCCLVSCECSQLSPPSMDWMDWPVSARQRLARISGYALMAVWMVDIYPHSPPLTGDRPCFALLQSHKLQCTDCPTYQIILLALIARRNHCLGSVRAALGLSPAFLLENPDCFDDGAAVVMTTGPRSRKKRFMPRSRLFEISIGFT